MAERRWRRDCRPELKKIISNYVSGLPADLAPPYLTSMLAGMELRHLRYFVAVAREENVTRAALKLHVSQPALSRQIRHLEDELGFLLLERQANSMRLTEGGRAFFIEAQAVLQRADDAVKVARAVASGNGGDLHIGYAPSLTARILPPALRLFQTNKPGVRVVWHDLSTAEMLAGLRDKKLHIAFLVRPTAAMLRGLQFQELISDPICVAVSPSHPFTRKRSVTPSLVAQEPLIAYNRKDYPEYHELLNRVFAPNQTKIRIVEQHESVTSLISAVEAGNGVSIAPESLSCISGPRLKLIPFSPGLEPVRVGGAWSVLSGVAGDFLDCAKIISRKAK
jgi:LysR family transcriptional regulator, benzoate and cis,cis-muconate-responsive activator of ben and cat genes